MVVGSRRTRALQSETALSGPFPGRDWKATFGFGGSRPVRGSFVGGVRRVLRLLKREGAIFVVAWEVKVSRERLLFETDWIARMRGWEMNVFL